MKLYMFRTVRLSIITSLLYTQQWYMSFRFVDSFRAGPGWNSYTDIFPLPVWHWRILRSCNHASDQVLLEGYLQTCMRYTIAECTVNKLLMTDRRTVRNM